ncbi:hypothetical protein ABEB36_013438 [Hypothenemus hampei]|uniref:Uncharacterized protein n=1 Tax=Hypothenemus hampei TaxID=57062 RepID=A0ABD1EAS4_HYPHA
MEDRECDKSKIEADDNESLLEKCWQEEYKGDSRKWLIRDASAKTPPSPLCSTMKESYLYPERGNPVERNMGKRREFLLKKFYQEAIEEVRTEYETTEESNGYCGTEYKDSFRTENFRPNHQFSTINKDSFQKHPLYSSVPVSYYSFNQKNNPKDVLHGLTRITDPLNMFKRNGQFSKPIQENLDFIEL